jgi:hypothetical protein
MRASTNKETIILIAFVAYAFWLPPRAMAQEQTTADDAIGAQAARPVAVELSEGYRTRAKIHKIASFATLPLFATELVLGQKLYDQPDSGLKGAHLGVATGIGVLFGVNSVTGVWNLVDAWKSPEHRNKKLLHGLLMLTADAGFFATAATGPGHERNGLEPTSGRQTHRAIAFTAIGVATAGYVIMLFGDH